MRRLARQCRMPESIVAVLYNRGLKSRDAIESHMTTTLASLNDPFTMKGMDRAVDRLVQAVERRETVGVFGDFDADGVTATAILLLFLRELGLPTVHYIPHRVKEGYGLNRQGLDRLAAAGCTLVVTVDCGITNLDEAAYAGDLGLDLIITDHHEPLGELPKALAVIDPKQPGCAFAFKELAGAGVAFCLVRALRSRLNSLGHWAGKAPPNLKRYLDLVAIGTVSDIVPLFDDNRIMVKAGLQVIDTGNRPGLRALMEAARLKNCTSAVDVAFRLGPRINAAGRMDHADKALELLLADDGGRAARLAGELDRLNQERQAQERRIFKEAIEQIEKEGDRPGYVLASRHWHQGIVGIVASKVMEQVARPVILLCQDDEHALGSGRCPEGFHLVEMLSMCRRFLLRYGGHRLAAGMKLAASDIEQFARAFSEVAGQTAASMEDGHALVPGLDIDWPASIHELSRPEYLRFLDQLAPFGPGYPQPVFAMQGFRVAERRVVGTSHLKITLVGPNGNGEGSGPRGAGVALLAWNHADKADLAWEDMELAFTPEVNVWQGRKSLQLVLKDARQRRV